MEKILMEDTLQHVLSQGNADQNQHYLPRIFERHYKQAANWLVDECVKLYPENDTVLSIIQPVLKVEHIKVIAGEITLPKDYRVKTSMSIYVLPDHSKACEIEVKDDATDEEIENARQEKRALSQPVKFVKQTEWDYLTQHPYKKPTLKKPIACIFEGGLIRIYPWDVPVVQLRYVKNLTKYKYGYTKNPDDTYSWDPSQTKDSDFTEPALVHLNNAVSLLYSVWVRDPEMKAGTQELSQLGLL